jgi:hypothetical protein
MFRNMLKREFEAPNVDPQLSSMVLVSAFGLDNQTNAVLSCKLLGTGMTFSFVRSCPRYPAANKYSL